MPPKERLPAPIDRPLAKAYLREFLGWSTEYPPGLSDPTSLRIMENVLINRDGSAQVRPGLRRVAGPGLQFVGSHESFYQNDGSKAYLITNRDAVTGTVGFMVFHVVGGVWQATDLVSAGFTVADAAALPFTSGTTYVKFLQIDNKIFAYSDNGEAPRYFTVGTTKTAKVLRSITAPGWGPAAKPEAIHPDGAWIDGTQSAYPIGEGWGATTILGISTETRDYNIGFFYTFYNEVGESAASPIFVEPLKRPWPQWRFEGADASGSPDGDPESDPKKCADQLVIRPPAATLSLAQSQGALGWNLYMLTWSNQGTVPPEGLLIGSQEFEPGVAVMIQMTPQNTGFTETISLPSENNLINYSDPHGPGNGLVAADRIILVDDPTSAAVVRWSSNQQGSYTDFSSRLGGGFKTLTSGNMQVPVAVKLWQNPQSVDTLTILCSGTDSYSTGYYMAPAAINANTDSAAIMGFEETTATPGTTSPYGVEVLNNALYHPLDEQLMKSMANNYNINHKEQTEAIHEDWAALINKNKIVSCSFDNRIYYIVHNPKGAPLEAGCNGNEIWVLDVRSTKTMIWSRFLIQAVSLRKIERGGRIYMSVTRPDGMFILDESYPFDDYYDAGNALVQRSIPWRLETNLQGANRAHDAWARLQRVGTVFGNAYGTIRYGIRSWDLNGKPVEINKTYRPPEQVDPQTRPAPYDHEDDLLIRRDLREWVFQASSVTDADGVVLPSFGRICYVQYLFAPVTVNVGYEYGSIETFEYGNSSLADVDRTSINGVPKPYIEPGRP